MLPSLAHTLGVKARALSNWQGFTRSSMRIKIGVDCPGRDGLSEFGDEEVQRGGVEPGHPTATPGVARQTCGREDPRRLVADITQPARSMAAQT